MAAVWEQIPSEDFQDGYRGDGGHFGYRNEIIFAILNLHVAQVPPARFWLNPTYRSGADVVWHFFQDDRFRGRLW